MVSISSGALERLATASRIAVLTGAGISAESGVPTFRGAEGLWRKFRPEELATPEAFARDPRLVWEWYQWRRQLIARLSPNAGHLALVELEKRADEFLLITQNVDGLHDRAGSKRMVKLHGDLWRLRCTGCSIEFEDRRAALPELPPRCRCGRLLRPAVVWFGEPLPSEAWERALEAAARCQLFISVGTSGIVYPAASLPLVAKRAGAYLIEVNVESTALSHIADEVILGCAAVVLPKLIAELSAAERQNLASS